MIKTMIFSLFLLFLLNSLTISFIGNSNGYMDVNSSSSTYYFVANVYLLNETFGPVYIEPVCVQLGNNTLYTYVGENKTIAVIKNTLYVNCDIDKPIITKITGLKREEDVYIIYMKTYISRKEGVYRNIIEIDYQKVTIIYDSYNDSFYRVVFNLQDPFIAISNPYILSQLWFKPSDVSNITIEFIVDKKSGEAYFVDDGKEIPIGSLPLLPSIHNAEKYLQALISNANNTFIFLKDNKWVLEPVIKRARRAENFTAKSRILLGMANNITRNIFQVKTTFLGLPVVGFLTGKYFKWYVDFDNSSFMFPGVESIRIFINFSDRIIRELKRPVEEYVFNHDPDLLEKYIVKLYTESITTKTYHPLFYNLRWEYPIEPTHIGNDAILPVPNKYKRIMHCSYLLIGLFAMPNTVAVDNFRIIYNDVELEPSIIMNENMVTYSCLSRVQNDVFNRIISMLDYFTEKNSVDNKKLDELREYVIQEIDACRQLLKSTSTNIVTNSGSETPMYISMYNNTTLPSSKEEGMSITSALIPVLGIIVLVTVLLLIFYFLVTKSKH